MISIVVAVGVTAILSLSTFSRSETWRATVPPLASIIGSGFLVSGPLLAREFGNRASYAMGLLLLLAYAVGAVIRFNIRNAEPMLATAGKDDPIGWLARSGQFLLALAYAVSVAFYLRLLAEFGLKNVAVAHALIGSVSVTVLIALFMGLALFGGLNRIEQLAHGTVSLKLGIVGGLLAALACHWFLNRGPVMSPPTLPTSLHSAGVLMGLLITVQGFEISRFLGQSFPAEVRIRSMRYAQWMSAAVYVGFILLLTPLLGLAARSEGVAGILDVMQFIAPGLGTLVLIGAASSQLSAAVADSIGSAGLLNEASGNRLTVKAGFVVSGALAIGVVWMTDPFQVIALASRAFALFYAVQCGLAIVVSIRSGQGGYLTRIGFAAIGVTCLVAMLAGAPAE